MILLCRINDTGIGYCPSCETTVSGRIIMGSSNVIAESSPASYMDCTFQGNCGHTSRLICSSKNLINGKPLGRMNDTVVGSINGRVIMGCSTVMSN
jgi:hypothetical protein